MLSPALDGRELRRRLSGRDDALLDEQDVLRRFVPLPVSHVRVRATRRIWHVEADALLVVLGVFLSRGELEGLFRDFAGEDRSGTREDLVLAEAASRCARVGRFSLAVERLLDERTHEVRRQVDVCPLAELAGLWLRTRETSSGRELAAILWGLARDRRWVIRGLFDRVRGDLWVRALRLLGDGHART
jgi:hypothetical protein